MLNALDHCLLLILLSDPVKAIRSRISATFQHMVLFTNILVFVSFLRLKVHVRHYCWILFPDHQPLHDKRDLCRP